MTETGSRRSLVREIVAGALLSLLVVGIAVAAAPPAALGALFGKAAPLGSLRHGDWGDNPERARKHAEFMTGYVLSEVDATPEQTAQITAIVLGFVQDMQGLRAEHRARHDALLAALSQPEVSRDTLETLRTEELASIDAVSQRLVDAVVNAAGVLTPEQRVKLVELAQEMHGGHGP
jgi:Spy/CpxP family protein refolding chaperone